MRNVSQAMRKSPTNTIQLKLLNIYPQLVIHTLEKFTKVVIDTYTYAYICYSSLCIWNQ